MIDLILSRPTVISLAVAGGLVSVAAAALRKRPGASQWARRLDLAGYAFMGTSMLLFVIIGLRGAQS